MNFAKNENTNNQIINKYSSILFLCDFPKNKGKLCKMVCYLAFHKTS